MKTHFTVPYLLNPQHPITVTVIGCGGTGSHVLAGLASLHEGLIGLNHPGLMVYAYDPDSVGEANIGRQKFTHSDIGRNKAEVLITRINRFLGLNWRSVGTVYKEGSFVSNITLSCVDSVKSRVDVLKALKRNKSKNNHRDPEPYNIPLYSMDFGNGRSNGQVLLSTVSEISHPEESSVRQLKGLFETFPGMLTQQEDPSVPSCSMREALRKQDLFVNATIAQTGLNLLWSLITDGKITERGAFIDSKRLRSAPIPV